MDLTTTPQQWDVGGQLRVLLRRWKTVVAVLLIVVTAALVSSLLQEPVYRGTVEVLLQRRASEVLLDVEEDGQSDQARRIETEMQVARSEPVRAEVRALLGPVPKAEVSQVGASDIIRISGRGATPEDAATLASAYADAYIEYRRRRAVEDLDQAGRKLQAKIDDLQRQLDTVDPRAAGARDQLATQLALYRQRLGDLRVDADLRSGGAQRVTTGAVPTEQVSPKPVRTGVMAGFVGLLLGVGIAWLREYLDESVKSKEDVERVLAGLPGANGTGIPILGLIPMIESWRDRAAPLVVSLDDAGSPTAEAYRSLRTSLQFIGVERAPRVIQVTSSNAGEGKTSTIANLGVAFARAGKQVVLVDCDLRRSRMHQFFGVADDIGFTSVFLGDARIEEALRSVRQVEGLFVLPSGPLPPNPSELLASERTAEIIHQLQDAFDVVLLDCPPVLPVTDATVVSGWVDATLLVAVPGLTSRRELHRTVELLRQVDAPLVGVVLNQTTRHSGYPAKYYEYRSKTDDRHPKRPAADWTPSPASRTGNGQRGAASRHLGAPEKSKAEVSES